MKVSNSSQLVLKLKGKKAALFVSAIKKIVDENNQIGFKKNILDDAELKVFKSLSDKLNHHE